MFKKELSYIKKIHPGIKKIMALKKKTGKTYKKQHLKNRVFCKLLVEILLKIS